MDINDEIAKAIFDQASELGWPLTQVAVSAGVGEMAVRKWKGRAGNMSAGPFLQLLRNMPGLHERLITNCSQRVAAA